MPALYLKDANSHIRETPAELAFQLFLLDAALWESRSELSYANYFKSQSSVERMLKAGLQGELKRSARAALKA
jgi:hypothetical protein